jgi:nicotinamidase-related amidase
MLDMKPALLVIDMQEDYFADGPLAEVRSALTSAINDLVAMAREHGCPVIWVRQEFEPDLSDAFLIMRKQSIAVTVKGTKGARLLHELDKLPHDDEIVKKRYSAFFRTDLDDILHRLKVDTLFIAGINTHACVRMAAIDAYQRDYEVFVINDCVSSFDEEHHRVSLNYLNGAVGQVVSRAELASLLQVVQ